MLKSLTVKLQEDLIDKARIYAISNKISLSELIGSLVKEKISDKAEKGSDARYDAVLKSIRKNAKPSKTNWKWNRDELYEDRVW